MLTFAYFADSGEDVMNQVLEIGNTGRRAVVPTLSFVALDQDGGALPDVAVTTVFGSDRGMVLVPARFGAIDVLIFTGARAGEVDDVRVTVRDVARVEMAGPITADLVVEPMDDTGAVVTRNDRFTAVQIRNDNETRVDVRLVYIVWDEPPAGRTQQAVRVVPVGDLFPIEGRTTVTMPMLGAAADAVAQMAGRAPASIKAYLAH